MSAVEIITFGCRLNALESEAIRGAAAAAGLAGAVVVNTCAVTAEAVRQARQEGWIGRKTPIALIGDAPSDVIAAKANRIRSIAVATGVSTEEELREQNPDLLLPDLGHLTMETLLEQKRREA